MTLKLAHQTFHITLCLMMMHTIQSLVTKGSAVQETSPGQDPITQTDTVVPLTPPPLQLTLLWGVYLFPACRRHINKIFVSTHTHTHIQTHTHTYIHTHTQIHLKRITYSNHAMRMLIQSHHTPQSHKARAHTSTSHTTIIQHACSYLHITHLNHTTRMLIQPLALM